MFIRAPLLAALSLVWGCSDPIPEGPRVAVTIDPAIEAGRLDPRYPGFAFDTAQLTRAMWWEAGNEERVPVGMPDLDDPVLRKVTSALAPSLMRVGGTDCNAFWFCSDPGPCEVPPAYRDTFLDPDRVETVLTHEALEDTADFAAAVGAEVLFCVNVGPGPRDPATGEWQPDDARSLLRVATALDNGEVFTAWEPGNEINVAFLNFASPYTIDPELFAADVEAFAALVEEEDPGALVVAPGSFVSPLGEVQDFTRGLMAELEARGSDPVDVVSWHLYQTQSTSCPVRVNEATAENLFDESLLDLHREFAALIREAAAGRPIWNTESASAQCGGQEGLSDSLADALWYADWVGVMAEEGSEGVVRHSLVGADYSLLEPDTFAPRPTFLALVLMRRTVAGPRLDTRVDRERLKAHGYVGAGAEGEVTAVLVNPTDAAVVAEIDLVGERVARGLRWTLTSEDGLTGRHATIEGHPTAADGTIPEPEGAPVAVAGGVAYSEVPPTSAVFVVLERRDGR
jgi:hypothetical protein